ncbi:MAG: alpha-hydroxy-acid oxidizing protein [Betaproteobacteria bacterium]|nr:alpha-hydroxy-acid oxidizing protein [Betaproteobacteria bacterium]
MSFERALNVFDLERMAKRRLPAGVFGFISGGAQDDRTRNNNRAALDRLRFKPRGLVDIAERGQDVTVFGHRFASPFGIAPMGIAGIARFEADIAMARAAARMNVPYVLSNMSTVPMEAVARSCDSVKWLQAYLPADRERSVRFVARAAAAGFQALLVTIDVPVGANRENNLRSGFTLPLHVTPRVIADGLLHPRWLTGVLLRTLAATGVPRLENSAAHDRPSILAAQNADLRAGGATIDWAFMRWLREEWRLPLLIKGVLHEADAREAVACGLDGVVVSNHGGRQLDGAVAPVEVLPEIVAAAGGRLTVIADSGFRRGGDILKGLALGAQLVLCGRPLLYGAALGGEAGVAHALQLLKAEVDRDLALLGATGIADLASADLLGALAKALPDGAAAP